MIMTGAEKQQTEKRLVVDPAEPTVDQPASSRVTSNKVEQSLSASNSTGEPRQAETESVSGARTLPGRAAGGMWRRFLLGVLFLQLLPIAAGLFVLLTDASAMPMLMGLFASHFRKDQQEALKQFNASLAVKKNATIMRERASCLFKLGHPREALAGAEEAAAMASDDPVVYAELATLRSYFGKYDQKTADNLRRSMKNKHAFSHADNWLFEYGCLGLIMCGKSDEALNEMQLALKEDKEDSAVTPSSSEEEEQDDEFLGHWSYLAGQCYLASGKYDKAVKAFMPPYHELFDTDRFTDRYAGAAAVAIKQGNLDEAKKILDTLNPLLNRPAEHPYMHLVRAWYFYRRGDVTQALEETDAVNKFLDPQKLWANPDKPPALLVETRLEGAQMQAACHRLRALIFKAQKNQEQSQHELQLVKDAGCDGSIFWLGTKSDEQPRLRLRSDSQEQ